VDLGEIGFIGAVGLAGIAALVWLTKRDRLPARASAVLRFLVVAGVGFLLVVLEGGLLGLAEGVAALPLRPEAEEPLLVQARALPRRRGDRTRGPDLSPRLATPTAPSSSSTTTPIWPSPATPTASIWAKATCRWRRHERFWDRR